METKRNGNFLDEFGACKVCGGEIPYGHTDNCDVWKFEKEIKEVQSNYDLLLKERGELIDYLKSLDYPPAQQGLVGPIELLKHIVNHLIRSRDLAVEDMKGATERSEQKSKTLEKQKNVLLKVTAISSIKKDYGYFVGPEFNDVRKEARKLE